MGKFLDSEGVGYLWGKTKELVSSEVAPLEEMVYKAHGSVAVSVSPSVIESGVETEVTVRNTVTLSGESFSPASVVVKEGSSQISTAANSTVTRTVSATTTYTAEATFIDGVKKSGSAKVTAVYPMYFGGSASSSLDSAGVTGLAKQGLKTSPNGSYTVSVGQGEYLWLCVPSGMKVNKVASAGFDVPMEAAATVAVSGKGNYSCYRSSSKFNAGSVAITVS